MVTIEDVRAFLDQFNVKAQIFGIRWALRMDRRFAIVSNNQTDERAKQSSDKETREGDLPTRYGNVSR